MNPKQISILAFNEEHMQWLKRYDSGATSLPVMIQYVQCHRRLASNRKDFRLSTSPLIPISKHLVHQSNLRLAFGSSPTACYSFIQNLCAIPRIDHLSLVGRPYNIFLDRSCTTIVTLYYNLCKPRSQCPWRRNIDQNKLPCVYIRIKTETAHKHIRLSFGRQNNFLCADPGGRAV